MTITKIGAVIHIPHELMEDVVTLEEMQRRWAKRKRKRDLMGRRDD